MKHRNAGGVCATRNKRERHRVWSLEGAPHYAWCGHLRVCHTGTSLCSQRYNMIRYGPDERYVYHTVGLYYRSTGCSRTVCAHITHTHTHKTKHYFRGTCIGGR